MRGLSSVSYRGMLMGNNDKGKGKVTEHATMMYGNGSKAPLINLCIRLRQVVSFISWETAPRTH